LLILLTSSVHNAHTGMIPKAKKHKSF
jgi:hypothetical protein